MNKEIKELWVKALSHYKQGKSFLREGDTYCCLGVLCDLFSKESGIPWKEDAIGREGVYSFMGSNSYLPEKVREWADLKSKNPIVLSDGTELGITDLNDGHSIPHADESVPPKSFEEIAKIIEEQL